MPIIERRAIMPVTEEKRPVVMLERVTMFKIPDGRVFESEKLALEELARMSLGEELEKLFELFEDVSKRDFIKFMIEKRLEFYRAFAAWVTSAELSGLIKEMPSGPRE